MAFNIVELATADSDNSAFDQPCRFGHRVEGHAVYCHNDKWDDSPRKCRRSWYTNGRVKDEDCAGFEANPEFKGKLQETPLVEPICDKCHGAKRVATDQGKTETCPLCIGLGSQPKAMVLSDFEQNILELGTTHSGRHDTAGHPFLGIAETDAERSSIESLCQLDLIVLRSVSFVGDASAYLLENTMKGEAVMRANWKGRGRLV
jgi:hypothetical protein